jgi:hypothetical protein
MKQRRLVQVSAHQAADGAFEQIERDARPHTATLQPPRDRARVPLGRALRGPRSVDRELLRHPVELGIRPGEGENGERTDLRDQSGVPACTSAADEEVRAFRVRLVRRDAVLTCERVHRIVSGSEERAAAIDGRAAVQLLGPDPAPDTVAGLTNHDGLPGLTQTPRGRKTGVTGPHDANVGIDPSHRRTLHPWTQNAPSRQGRR